MSSKTDYFENKLTDFLWRGQTLTVGGAIATWSTAPTFYVGLFTAIPTDSTAGVEVIGGSYARQPIVVSLTTMAGTQAAASTTASTGVNGTTSNNNTLTFVDMPEAMGTTALQAFGIFDALTGGNLLEYAPLNGAPISASAGAVLTFSPGSLTIQEDN